MTAFFIATSTIKNPEKFQEYGRQAAATLAAHGGELVLRGKYETALTALTQSDHQAVGVITFPSLKALNDWHQSDVYQALIPLRDEAVDMVITTYSVPS